MMFGFTLPRIESRALKYGYSSARVKAMKGLLLKQGFLDDLIRSGSIEAMIELLQRTSYKGDFAEASVQYTGSELIELSAARSFSRTVAKLIRITPPGDRKILQALLLKYDLLNLKTIMHAKRLGKTYEEVRPYIVPVGGITEDDVKRLMRAEGSNIYREIKRTGVGKKMLAESTASFSRKMWERFNEGLKSLDSFMQMETIIDGYIYLLMDKELSSSGSTEIGSIRKVMKREIDAKNVMIIERLKKHGMDQKKIRDNLIRGGTLNDALLSRIMDAKDLQATMSLIRNKFKKLQLGKENAGLTDLEIALEKSIAAERSIVFYRAILSAGVVIGFLLLKEEEANNLRKIAKGKEFGIPEKEIREMLVVI